MTNWLAKLANAMSGDRAESSIMQTITVAVSAIVIAAGTVTMPGIINSQKENTVKSQLGNVAFAEEAWLAANGFVNTNFVPGENDDSVYPVGHPKVGQEVPNLSNWKYPYDFSSFAFESTGSNFDCYKGEYVIWADLKNGKRFYVTSDNATPVEEAGLEIPVTCRDGYVPDVDTIPSVPDRIQPPSTTPSDPTLSDDKELLSWTVATCAAGTTPAYQIRTTVGEAPEKTSAGWSNSTNQSLEFLNDAHKVSGTTTVYAIAAKCRDDQSGALSPDEVVTTGAQSLTSTS